MKHVTNPNPVQYRLIWKEDGLTNVVTVLGMQAVIDTVNKYDILRVKMQARRLHVDAPTWEEVATTEIDSGILRLIWSCRGGIETR